MPFVIAVIIIMLISFVSVKFRCYACFNLLIIGFSAFIAGMISKESLFTVGGAAFFLGGLLVMFLTSLKVHKRRRLAYMGNLFLSGLFFFLQVMLFMMIITIGISSICAAAAKTYREKVVVDSYGNVVDRVYVDENNTDAYGRKYDTYDPY